MLTVPPYMGRKTDIILHSTLKGHYSIVNVMSVPVRAVQPSRETNINSTHIITGIRHHNEC